jgi:repressor LexA
MARTAHDHESRTLTPRQLAILQFLRDYRRSRGYSPTMQEVADELGITKVTVFEHVGKLVDKGLIRRLPYRARSLELTSIVSFPDERAGALPLLGRIAAGQPIEAIENPETLDLQEVFAGRGERFVLKVTGDSMIDDHIRDGDYVVVEKRTRVRDGEAVVALLEGGEATLKRFYRERKGRVRLQPANPDYAPIRVDADRLDIQGVVVGVIRKY